MSCLRRPPAPALDGINEALVHCEQLIARIRGIAVIDRWPRRELRRTANAVTCQHGTRLAGERLDRERLCRRMWTGKAPPFSPAARSRAERDKNATCGRICQRNQHPFLARQAGARDQHLHLLVVAPPERHRRQDRRLRLAPAGALTSAVRPSLSAAAHATTAGWRRRDARQIASPAPDSRTCGAAGGYSEARAAPS